MKISFKPLVILPLFAGVLFQSCIKNKCEETVTYKAYKPVYMSYEDLRVSVKSDDPGTLENPGKIYFKDNYIYINEHKKGVHIVDNNNPAAPSIIGFINIPGNVDVAIKGDVLYADSYIDLVAIDISDPLNVSEVKRVENVFPYVTDYWTSDLDESQGVVVDWNEEMVTETFSCNDRRRRNMFRNQPVAMDNGVDNTANFEAGAGNGRSSDGTGKSGSMARFSINDSYLYTIDQSNLEIFEISNPYEPVQGTEIWIGSNIETIFPYKDKLFIGSQSGMFILENSNPSNPHVITEFDHATACDPVVVNDDYAFVTLRSGRQCWGELNQLDVINIEDVYSPWLDRSYEMTSPNGLGINDNETLFLCDGDAGLKVYDISDPTDLKMLNHFTGHATFDVIPNGGIIMVIGADGLYQYSYDEAYNLTLLSKMPVKNRM